MLSSQLDRSGFGKQAEVTPAGLLDVVLCKILCRQQQSDDVPFMTLRACAGELPVHAQQGHRALLAAHVGGVPPPAARGLAGGLWRRGGARTTSITLWGAKHQLS